MAELWQRGTVTLKWSPEHEMHGLEIVMRRRPYGGVVNDWLEEGDDERLWADLLPKERAARSQKAGEDFIAQVISWNLADAGGNPVPITLEGLFGECDGVMITQMQVAYSEATTKLAPPLPESSDDGPDERPEIPGEWDLSTAEVLSD